MDDTTLKQQNTLSIDFFDHPYYRINKVFLMMMGRWPYQERKQRILISSVICIGILTVVIPELIKLFRVFQDLTQVIDCLLALMVTYAAYVMFFNSILTCDFMKSILEEIKINWRSLKNSIELQIFRDYAQEGRLLIIFYSVLVTLSVFSFIGIPLLPRLLDYVRPLNESRPLKNFLQAEYFVDEEDYFVAIYVHGIQAALFVVFIVIATDAYFVMIVQHICGMFAVLGHRLGEVSHANSDTVNLYSDRERDIIISDRIAECVKYHCDCIRFSEMIEDSFVTSFILQIFVNMVIVSVAGVQTILVTSEPQEVLKNGLNTISSLFRSFYICWAGQKVYDHSDNVHKYLSNIDWYKFPPKAKKMIFIMMMRSSRPCHITAGKMMSLNFQSYAKLVKTSMSFFTMILSTQ